MSTVLVGKTNSDTMQVTSTDVGKRMAGHTTNNVCRLILSPPLYLLVIGRCVDTCQNLDQSPEVDTTTFNHTNLWK